MEKSRTNPVCGNAYTRRGERYKTTYGTKQTKNRRVQWAHPPTCETQHRTEMSSQLMEERLSHTINNAGKTGSLMKSNRNNMNSQ